MIRALFLYLAVSCFGLDYPVPRIDPQIDDYHGTAVPDPYRYLENSNSPETLDWIAAENALTSSYLEQVPQREAIRKKLESLWNYEKYYSILPDRSLYIVNKGGRYFFSRNDGLQNQPVVYVMESLDGKPEILMDPNGLSEDGTTSLTISTPSDDGKWFAYGLARSGSDWLEIRIRNVETKEDLNDRLLWVKFTAIAWVPSGKGFYYCRFDEPEEETKYEAAAGLHQIYYHELGTEQENDRCIFTCPEGKNLYLKPLVDSEGKYLIIVINEGFNIKNAIFYKELESDEGPISGLFPNFDARYSYIGNRGTQFWFLTDLGAPLKRVISIDLEEKVVKEVVPEGKNALESVTLVGDRFILDYLKDATSLIQVHRLDGTVEQNIPLPSIGRAESFLGKQSDEEVFFSFRSFTQPLSIYRHHFSTRKTQLLFQPKLSFSPHDFETKQVFYESRDGTRVPLFLSYKKGTPFNGTHPAYLYGYGGFGSSIAPFYSTESLSLMEMGGILAVVNLRGGSEYGKSWHEAGMLEKKQNVFDDFIAAAEWLVAKKITATPKLAIGGRSNGGLLIGACLNQRPDLFGAALPMVGVQDMLRYQQFTAGKYWIAEYGSSDDPEQFSYLYRYSPLHNIQKRAYPPTFILTADHDDRVVPAHSYKYAATLQKAQTAPNPILIRISSAAGHGLDKPISKQIDEATEKLAFLVSLGFFQGL